MDAPVLSISRAPGSPRIRRVVLPLAAGALALLVGWAVIDAAPALAAPTQNIAVHTVPAHLISDHDAIHLPDWTIAITAVGLQAEVDQCQWVRMDFSSAVPLPIVAAHNFCGGGIVLEMTIGQSVVLSGTGLDGRYVVVGSKDAWADQDATDALSGLAGDVILQTCYWDDNGHLMLVTLQRVA